MLIRLRMELVCAWRNTGAMVGSTLPTKRRTFPIATPRYDTVNSIVSLERGTVNAVAAGANSRAAVVAAATGDSSAGGTCAGTARERRSATEGASTGTRAARSVPRLASARTVGRELAADVEEDLVHVHGGVRIRARDRLRMKVERPGDERADERSAGGERAVPGGRQVDEPGPRLEVQDRERERVERSVPADDVERRGLEAKAVERAAPLHDELADALVGGPLPLDAPEVAVRVGRVHPQLAGLVPPLRREVNPAGRLDREPALRPRVRDEPVEEAARHVDVIVLLEAEVPER